MSRLRTSLAALACSLLLSGLLKAGDPPTPSDAGRKADPRPPAGVIHLSDLTYSEKTGMQLDLACPEKLLSPAPAVLVLHGGFWQGIGGSRKSCLPVAFLLAQRGFVVAAASYRKATDAPFPAQIHDAKCAVRWLRAHADEYHIDPERIGVLGYSSGGHLAGLLGTTAGNLSFEGDGGHAGQSSRIQAVVDCYGPADLAALYEHCEHGPFSALEKTLGKAVLENLVGGTPANQPGRYAGASPVTHAGKHAAPTLLIHGTADRQVPLAQSQRFADRLRQAGVEVRLLRLENAGHAIGSGWGGEHGRQADAAAVEFFEQALRPRLAGR
jgi:acetyl esterase/lipase